MERGNNLTQMKSFACPNCPNKFCPHCSDDVHEGTTCEQYKQWKIDNNEGEQRFQDYMKAQKFKNCPHCGVPCERFSGCKFMTCNSQECKKQKFFCYLCGTKLEHSQHWTHFFNSPFGEHC
mmetsp:Transcript_11680/g.11598  ORF Transcript_11680/g.11598 Transcript_11680/m.11598 type:complete len:121 (+) Transcript_11680:209-571(+)